MFVSPSPRVAILALLLVTSCRDAAGEDDAKPPLAPECGSYLEAANTCLAKATDRAKPAVDAVYKANKKAIDSVKTAAGAEALAKQCTKWTGLLAKNPQCK